MKCPYYSLGWKECAQAKKRDRKTLDQIIHLAKGLITKDKDLMEKAKKIFGPLAFFAALIILSESLAGIASMFYTK